MVLECKSLLITDGYQLNLADGYSFTSPWVKVLDVNTFSISASFVGGSPLGFVFLQQSNDLEADTGAAMGNGGVNPIYPVTQGPALSIPRWADPYRGSSFVNDTANVPSSSNGTVSQAVNGAGTYVLNQWLAGYSFVRIVYTSVANANTAITLKMTIKG